MSGSDSPTFFHGQPWSSWIEKIGRDKPLSDEEPELEPASSVMRLSVDDIDLYGFCPERDTFYGVVCEICNSIVKPQALIQHMESRHPSGSQSLPPPQNNTASKPIMKTPYCKLSKLKKSQSTGQISVTNNGTNAGNNSTSNKTSNNHTPVKQRATAAEQQPNNSGLPSASPRSPLESSSSLSTGLSPSIVSNAISGSGNSPVKSPGNQPKRKRLKPERSLLKDREYDPDRHCGVWNEETGKPCTRSLTCKAHTVSLRRHVAGRSKSFDKLLAEHRASKELPNTKTQTKITSATAVTASSISATSSTTMSSTAVLGTISVAIPELSTASALTPSTPAVNPVATSVASLPELDPPSSPPVLSLPDTYPLDKYPHLPQAVDLLYRCLDPPHGSNKPTKLDENFTTELDSSQRVDSSVVNNASNNNIMPTGSSNSTISNNSVMTPISVVLPSLSPIPTGSMSPQTPLLQFSRNSPAGVDQIINKQSPASIPVAPTVLPVNNQPTSSTNVVLEAKTAPMDIDSSQNITMYTSSPLYKDVNKSQVTVQISRTNVANQLQSRNYSNIYDSMSNSMGIDHTSNDVSTRNHLMTNGKLSNHHSDIQNIQQVGKLRHEFTQDYSSALQLEATPASATPFTTFDDITWSNCHPEPLAVTKWLRINSSRKQYNFNIH